LEAVRVLLEERIGMKVSLKGTSEQGELKIRYKSKEDLELLRRALAGDANAAPS
jgi:hypothetical protein